jgi:hypothetical protein
MGKQHDAMTNPVSFEAGFSDDPESGSTNRYPMVEPINTPTPDELA